LRLKYLLLSLLSILAIAAFVATAIATPGRFTKLDDGLHLRANHGGIFCDSADGDTIVWGTLAEGDNIVWGTDLADTIV